MNKIWMAWRQFSLGLDAPVLVFLIRFTQHVFAVVAKAMLRLI